MYLDDMRLLRLEKAEYLTPTADARTFDSLLQRRKPPVDYAIGPVPPPRDPLAAERKKAIECAVSQMPYDDGDPLPEGHYVVAEDGELVRTGPAQVQVGWHGASAPADTAVDLEPRAPMVDGRGHLREVPAIYVTPQPLLAQNIAFDRWRVRRDQGKGEEQRPQMYEVVVAPSETVELGDCTDASTVVEAVNSGADVLECPDWVNRGGKAVPEIVILNDDTHHTARVWQVDELPERDVSETAKKTERALRADPQVGPPPPPRSIKRPRGMPRHTTYKDLPARPRKPSHHPYLRKGKR